MTQAATWARPRIGSKRHPGRRSLGFVYPDIAQAMGFTPYPWQHFVAQASLELRPRAQAGQAIQLHGSRLRLAAGNVGVMMGRQSGKSLWTASRVGLQCMLPDLPQAAKQVGLSRIKPQICGITAQDRIGALGRWYEHVEMITSGDLNQYVEKVKRKNGEEAIEFTNGSVYRVITPSRTGARGSHYDLVVIDEALAHESWLMGVIRPTQAQRDGATGCIGAQLVVVSNAGDETSQLLNEQRELGRRAVATDDPKRCWFEWSAPDDADVYDENVWRSTLPTLDLTDGISLEFIRTEAESMAVEDFAREYLCRFTPRRHAYVIDPALWENLPDVGLPEGPVILGIDATRERTSAAVVAAASNLDYIAVEVLEQRLGTDWVVPFVVDLASRNIVDVIIDAYGPMAAVIPSLERAGIQVHGVRVGDVTTAAQSFAELVSIGGLSHQRDPRFLPKAVTRRRVGDRWAFQRAGDEDISPFVAASLAAWGVQEGLLVPPQIH